MTFADPRNDIAFKKIFGDESKKEILISLLNAVLDFQGDRTIADLHIVNPYQVPKIEGLKNTILDIKAKNQKGEEFIVEMQKKDLGDFAKRSLYYTSKAYVAQLGTSEDYTILNKVYFIGILNFDMFEESSYISRHLILNKETLKQELADFEFTFVELNKFNKSLEELETILDKWLFFIKNARDLTIIPKQLQTEHEFKEAFEVASQHNWNKEEMESYSSIALRIVDDINAIKTAELKGEAIGMEKGKAEGEQQAKIQIAKNLLDILDNNTISLKTGLSINAIENLRQ